LALFRKTYTLGWGQPVPAKHLVSRTRLALPLPAMFSAKDTPPGVFTKGASGPIIRLMGCANREDYWVI
jgi:hypothetical protein